MAEEFVPTRKALFKMEKEERRIIEDCLIAGWSKRYGRPINIDEVREINANLSAFVDVMRRIDLYIQIQEKKRAEMVEK